MKTNTKLRLVTTQTEPLTTTAHERLIEFMQGRRGQSFPPNFAVFERELHSKIAEVEREILADELAKADVDEPSIVVEGTTYRRVLRSKQTYQTAAGNVNIERTLYKDRTVSDAVAIVPLDMHVGIIDGRWTPLAAEQAVWVVSQMTPQLAEELFARTGHMQPSKSSLDRLPKVISERWEDNRIEFERVLREGLQIPPGTKTIAISIDGVLAPMKATDPVGTRTRAASKGKLAKGPAGYREVGCGTLSFCDADGKMMSAIRIARMPEPHKATMKSSLLAELTGILKQRPNLKLVKLADGAKDNWTYLSDEVPEGAEIVDFYHAIEHLNSALGTAYGDGSLDAQRRLNDLRHVLRHEDSGVNKVITALTNLRRKHPKRTLIATQLQYFRNNRARMQYATMAKLGYPIGSGVVEAACKTLVSQRLKCSGMRWGHDGGQAILTVRGWTQSERFDQAWALLAATYAVTVTTVENVIDFQSAKANRASR